MIKINNQQAFSISENQQVAFIPGNQCRTLSSFYFNIKQALHFPEYFGNNLDALEDALYDLSTSVKDPILLCITDFNLLCIDEAEEKRATLLSILSESEGDQFRIVAIG